MDSQSSLRDTACAMPEENAAEIVRQTMEAANRRDLATMDKLISEELEFNSTFAASEGRVFRGHTGIREYFATLEDAFDDLRLDAEDVIAAGDDRVVLLVWVSGRGKGSDIPVRHCYGQVWTVSNGAVRQIDSYLDPAEALRAAGVST
jgi:ketosteroid isomerase-like protein